MSIFLFSILSKNKKKISDIKTNSECTVESKLKPKTEWNSIYLNSFITFVSAMQFTLFFSTLWSFMKLVCLHSFLLKKK